MVGSTLRWATVVHLGVAAQHQVAEPWLARADEQAVDRAALGDADVSALLEALDLLCFGVEHHLVQEGVGRCEQKV